MFGINTKSTPLSPSKFSQLLNILKHCDLLDFLVYDINEKMNTLSQILTGKLSKLVTI